ncbi:hypothetical protein O9G_003719 [Rozella allomycis CSF55]|uniref:Uncharacterized protein n=1 Tax=Rozella allomycis (strain CSF55) TaxID=988480 RepID=A0A075ARX5_ROZAC|nr:hypothetical protein O9G_003719 [Rozella allomycis CSF55]|eukprot:EPZ32988.1 hypothetical protein O9G_003719 [Rozella allomycis CSF55]
MVQVTAEEMPRPPSLIGYNQALLSDKTISKVCLNERTVKGFCVHEPEGGEPIDYDVLSEVPKTRHFLRQCIQASTKKVLMRLFSK